MIVVVQFILILLALSRDTTKSLVRSWMQLCSLIWSDSLPDTVAYAFSYCQIDILGMCYCNILFFTNTLQFIFQIIVSPHDFYILRAFIINNPAVLWYHWFKFLDLLFGFLFLNPCAIQLCFNCINSLLQLLHFRNRNVLFWIHDICINLKICHTTFH